MRTISVQIMMRNENCQRKKTDRKCVLFIYFFKASQECLKKKEIPCFPKYKT